MILAEPIRWKPRTDDQNVEHRLLLLEGGKGSRRNEFQTHRLLYMVNETYLNSRVQRMAMK